MKEVWKDIIGFKNLYQISDLGRVKSLDRFVYNGKESKRFCKGIILAQNIANHGYKSVMLTNGSIRKRFLVHKLVCQSFLGFDSDRKWVIDHINDNKLDNRLINLQILSNRDNSTKKPIGYSKYVGVSYNKKRDRFYSAIYINGKSKFLGGYSNEYDAHLAYEKAKKEIVKKGNEFINIEFTTI